ncbi:hypothetical protein [Pseudomonas sp. A-B-19]|jgi:hypothetical protein|uniref:hypothetical protein n=1 Tax=Pseudomonas sp. A-B-19 TaxID=2832405 RepID=UPI001CBC777F|nr:hypothetical protein [Pseudomonas sp. A-B-19]
MTSIDTWSPWIAITVAGGPILVGVVNIAYCFYLSRRHLDAMMEALKNSRHILIWGPVWRRQGWFGGYALVSTIAGMVVWPNAYIRYGQVASEDIENFPPHLKRLLVIYAVGVTVTLTGMAITYVLLELR